MSQFQSSSRSHAYLQFIRDTLLQRSTYKPRWPLIALVAYTAILLFGTHAPTDPVPFVFNMQDKLIHTVCYCGLALLTFLTATTRGWFPEWAVSWSQRALLVIVATSAFGAFDELTQYFAPGRIVDLYDWFANVSGCLLGALIFSAWSNRRIATRSVSEG